MVKAKEKNILFPLINYEQLTPNSDRDYNTKYIATNGFSDICR